MKKVLITGGCGFIGSNLAKSLILKGTNVTLFDNLSREGSVKNLEWLKANYDNSFEFIEGDIRNYDAIKKVIPGKDSIFHLAAQVAVTTSVKDPKTDFDINALGTFNVLEAIRETKSNATLVYSSTNKVYGGMQTVIINEDKTRYKYRDFPNGIDEQQLLDFHSPYGCSKGAADQYVRDYNRIYGINTIVFRQSCIYGSRQFGVEDQGWVAWFLIAAELGKQITIYGNGKQARDLLYVDDLIIAYETAVENIQITSGKIYNIGGGPSNILSVWKEFGPKLKNLKQKEINVLYSNWRPGDQKLYVSNISKAYKDFGWKPQTSVDNGLKKLAGWVRDNKEIFM